MHATGSLPAATCSDEVLAVAAQCSCGGQYLVGEQIAEEAALVVLGVDVERPEDMARLPTLQETEDGERDREQEHRPPAEDQWVAEEEEDDSRNPEEDDADVEARDEVVDPGDQFREDAWLCGRWMHAEPFEHAARPAGALVQEDAQPLGDDGEAECDRLILYEPACREHGPGEHDVLADRIGPATDGAQVTRAVGGERALSDERGVVRRLHALHTVDPQSVVPLLHACNEGRKRVLGDEGACTGADVLALRRARHASYEPRERLLLQERVGIDRHHQRCRHRLQGGVESVVLALSFLEDPSVRERKASARARPPAGPCRRSSCCRLPRLPDHRGMKGRRCVRACERSRRSRSMPPPGSSPKATRPPPSRPWEDRAVAPHSV